MKINIGSKNNAKIEALKELADEYDELKGAEVFSVEVDSGVSHQPKSLEEIIEGATGRAVKSFTDCDLSFGIESGLMSVPKTKTGFMDVSCCAIFDGKEVMLGLSSAFEFPPDIISHIFKNDSNASIAAKELGFTKSEYVGHEEGVIGVLTRNKITRKIFTQQAIRTALVQLQNKKLYNIK